MRDNIRHFILDSENQQFSLKLQIFPTLHVYELVTRKPWQGNRAMPQLFFSAQSWPTAFTKLRKPGFRAPNMAMQNRI